MSYSGTRKTRVVVAAVGVAALAGCTTDTPAVPSSTSIDASAPVVGGPNPADLSNLPGPTSSTALIAQCGTVRGPDGSLDVTITSGDIACAAAREVAEQYAPKIVTGKPQSVLGWDCGPGKIRGVLAACTKDGAEITFAP